MSAFTFTGAFGGFIRLANGKRRMILRTLGQELVLKVPRSLREELDGMLNLGGTLTVHGVEEPDGEHRKFIVSEIELTAEHRLNGCTVRVCSKKNCWRQGGREVAHMLEKEFEHSGLDRVARLKLSGCLDCCKNAPTIACNEHLIERCEQETVMKLVERLRARLLQT